MASSPQVEDGTRCVPVQSANRKRGNPPPSHSRLKMHTLALNAGCRSSLDSRGFRAAVFMPTKKRTKPRAPLDSGSCTVKFTGRGALLAGPCCTSDTRAPWATRGAHVSRAAGWTEVRARWACTETRPNRMRVLQSRRGPWTSTSSRTEEFLGCGCTVRRRRRGHASRAPSWI
jgi:hypothetical protein